MFSSLVESCGCDYNCSFGSYCRSPLQVGLSWASVDICFQSVLFFKFRFSTSLYICFYYLPTIERIPFRKSVVIHTRHSKQDSNSFDIRLSVDASAALFTWSSTVIETAPIALMDRTCCETMAQMSPMQRCWC